MIADQKTVFIGIIGGTGLENPEILTDAEDVVVTTPFGRPSDSVKVGTISGVKCALFPRHGRKHDISPSDVNYKANLYALKQLGCTHVIATTACGSLQHEYAPGDLVFIDQFIDKTKKDRGRTFYDGKSKEFPGICHLPMGTPYCDATRKILIDTATELSIKHHKFGTVVCIEGPRFSTKAESLMFKSWGAHIIGMTQVPEVCLAKELGLFYAAIALATDYDSWREDFSEVDVESVLEVFRAHSKKTVELLKVAVSRIAEKNWTEDSKKLETMVKKAIMGV